jgi:hypothetical protein
LIFSHDIDHIQSGEGKAAESPQRPIISFVAPLEHPRRRVEADSLARHARHNERDSPPVLLGPGGVSRAICHNHVPLALASLTIGLSVLSKPYRG